MEAVCPIDWEDWAEASWCVCVCVCVCVFAQSQGHALSLDESSAPVAISKAYSRAVVSLSMHGSRFREY